MYKFLNLKHQLLNDAEDQFMILSQSSTIVESDELNYTHTKNGLGLLQKVLNNYEDYYVIHDVQKYKGKKMVWSGHTVIASKTNILAYIAEELSNNNLRPIKIMAKNNPNFVIRITDETVFCLHKQN